MSLARFPGFSLQHDERAFETDWSRRNENVKRQRTTSGSASSASQSKICRRGAESEDEVEKPEKSKIIRGAAARNHRNKEVRDREAQREKERADAHGNRKGRAERRRGDGNVPQSSLNYLTLLRFCIDRVRSFPSTTLAKCVFKGCQHQQRSLRCSCPSRPPAIQSRAEKDWAATCKARSRWKESIHQRSRPSRRDSDHHDLTCTK